MYSGSFRDISDKVGRRSTSSVPAVDECVLEHCVCITSTYMYKFMSVHVPGYNCSFMYIAKYLTKLR